MCQGQAIPVLCRVFYHVLTPVYVLLGWYGAMCQGQAISVLCRAFYVSKRKEYLIAARAAIKVFQKSSQVCRYSYLQYPYSANHLPSLVMFFVTVTFLTGYLIFPLCCVVDFF